MDELFRLFVPIGLVELVCSGNYSTYFALSNKCRWFNEKISKSKYEKYKDYIRQVPLVELSSGNLLTNDQ